ncbi:MAG: AraC family transcriptional regulator [Clostridiaceae bacterium]|nr:AraC family transcriptional regulator [Clostridiaceae bacterium]
MPCIFTDRPEYGNTTLLDFSTNGNNTALPFFYKVSTTCQLIPHRHSYIQMVYIKKGQLTHACGSHINDLRCGDLILIPPYLPHYFIPIAERSFELIEFEFVSEFIDASLAGGAAYDGCDALEWLSDYTDGHTFPLVSLTGEMRFDVENGFARIEREYKEQPEGFMSAIRGVTLLLLAYQRRMLHMRDENDGTALLYERHREVLLRSLDFIRDNYTRDITVQDAAAVAIMSPSYYRHYFKLLTKKTFTEYLNGLRVAHAITLIRENPRMKIVDICYAAGFSNISHFNRTFLKVTGVTPKAFRISAAQSDVTDLQNSI